MGESLQADILARFNEAPERPCFCIYGPSETVCWYSRRQVYARASAIAQQLKLHGAGRGCVCVIVLPSGETAANMLLGALFIGAIPLLVAPPSLVGGNLELRETLVSAIHRTRPGIVIYSSPHDLDLAALKNRFPAARFVFSGILEAGASSEPFTPIHPAPSDILAMQLTSGTTAAPRICVWDQKGVLAALNGMAAAMELSPDDVCVNWTPLYHDMGLVNNFFLCLTRGIPFVMLSPQDFVRRPALWLRSLSQTGGTITWAPNFGFAITERKAEDRELLGVRLDRVRGFWNAAERIHQRTFDLFYQRFSMLGLRREALKTNFGCAENIGGATFSAPGELPRCEYIDQRFLDEYGSAKTSTRANKGESIAVVSCGKGYPGVTVKIVSPSGRTLPDGQVGEICLDTPSRMVAYHQNARETRRRFRGGLLHTGDIGYLRNGELFWVGRLRERITIQGKKIDPSALEDILDSTPGVREGCFAAFGIPDERSGTERLVVVCELRSPATENLRNLHSILRQKCFLRLGVTPVDIVFVPATTLSKTSSGKRRHRYFRKLYLGGGLESARIPVTGSTSLPLREALHLAPSKCPEQGTV